MRLYALRGAAGVDENTDTSILAATTELMYELLERNDLGPSDVISCLFTLTPDLDAQFPAVAARELGFEHVPLICAQEIDVAGAMPRVVRVLMHYHAPNGHKPQHVYLGRAMALRTDLDSAQ
ncbi:MAG TPA: chorismate mutase [Baekduia sp.]|nr:chorismate mutase [Baekduia sp.]